MWEESKEGREKEWKGGEKYGTGRERRSRRNGIKGKRIRGRRERNDEMRLGREEGRVKD